MVLLAVACGGSKAAPAGLDPIPDAGSGAVTPPAAIDAGGIQADAGATPDAGTVSDAGSVADGGSTADAGAADAGSPFDGGTIASLAVHACPSNPTLLWSRDINTADVDFRGATDESGNLYWIEYQPPWTPQNQHPPAFLTSADSNGHDRFRVPAPVASDQLTGPFMVADGKVFMSGGPKLAAYDASTGALSWTLDLTAMFPSGNVNSVADASSGKVVFGIGNSQSSAVFEIDANTGAVVWSKIASVDKGMTVLGTDGNGSVLVRANFTEISSPFRILWEYLQLDAGGHEIWREDRVDETWLLAWPSGLPWLQSSTPMPSDTHLLRAPPGWFSAVAGDDFGFAFDNATLNPFPLGVSALRGGKVTAAGILSQVDTFDGVSVLPFLAGDHAVFVTQEFHAHAGLCHPSGAGAAFIGHVDGSSASLCPLAPAGDSPIDGAALLPGRLIVGRRTVLNEGCGGDQFQPFTIEAYSLPGESLSTAGWVQRGGSRGLGMRPAKP
jgi:outer membrane protein assembly factor BamB